MEALPTFIVATVAALIACVGFHVLYQLFFNPISEIPGPRLPGISRGYEMYYDLIKIVTFLWKLVELHVKYGQ